MANSKNNKKDINSRLMDFVAVKNLNPTIFSLKILEAKK